MIQTPETRGEGVTKTPEKGKAAAYLIARPLRAEFECVGSAVTLPGCELISPGHAARSLRASALSSLQSGLKTHPLCWVVMESK